VARDAKLSSIRIAIVEINGCALNAAFVDTLGCASRGMGNDFMFGPYLASQALQEMKP